MAEKKTADPAPAPQPSRRESELAFVDSCRRYIRQIQLLAGEIGDSLDHIEREALLGAGAEAEATPTPAG